MRCGHSRSYWRFAMVLGNINCGIHRNGFAINYFGKYRDRRQCIGVSIGASNRRSAFSRTRCLIVNALSEIVHRQQLKGRVEHQGVSLDKGKSMGLRDERETGAASQRDRRTDGFLRC